MVHSTELISPQNFWTAWSLEPGVVAGLGLTAWLYSRGLWRLWDNAGSGHGIRRWEALLFGLGLAGLAVALVSPLHLMGQVLFSAHMAQHELLMVVTAPLLVLGRPIVAFLWAVPISWRRIAGGISARSSVQRTWYLLTLPALAWTVHAIAIWLWHVPALFRGHPGQRSDTYGPTSDLPGICPAVLVVAASGARGPPGASGRDPLPLYNGAAHQPARSFADLQRPRLVPVVPVRARPHGD